MDFRIEQRSEFSLLSVQLAAGEKIKVEAGAMAAMTTNLQLRTQWRGGLKRILTGESIFISEYSATSEAEISLAPGLTGDIEHVRLQAGEKFYLSSSCFLASSADIQWDTKFQGLGRGFFSGSGFFLLQMHGQGDLWFNCYGALLAIDVEDEYIVDTGHIVAFSEGLQYEISKIGGYKSLFFSGEGFVAKFSGKGRLWIQTKNSAALVHWADAYRRVQRSNN